MQPLLDGPRSTLTQQQVKDLLQSHSSIQITYGADALDSSLQQVADISEYVSGGSIASDVSATTQRTCTITIDADVTNSGWSYLSGFIKPYQTITDTDSGVSARFNLGVYTLTTPDRVLGTTPAQLSFSGYDLTYLLNQEIGDSYEVAAGSDPAQAAADVINLAVPEAGAVVTPSGTAMAHQMTWPLDQNNPVTYLKIIQDLLSTVGYREVWVDWEGKFHVQPYIDLETEAYEWTFDTTSEFNILADGRSQNIDLWNVPNWWRFIQADLKDTPMEGQTQFTYEDASAGNPGSVKNRGRYFRHIEYVSTSNYTDLVEYAKRTISLTLQPAEVYTVTSQPFPLAWHLDVIHYVDPALSAALPITPSGERRVVALTWNLPLDGMSDMQWTWQTVSDQTADLALSSTVEAAGGS